MTLIYKIFRYTWHQGGQGTKIRNITHLIPRWVVFGWSEKNLVPRVLKFDFRPYFYKNACAVLFIVFLILILHLRYVNNIYVHLIWNIPKFGYINSKYLKIDWIGYAIFLSILRTRNTCWFLFTHFYWKIWKIWKQQQIR